MRRILVAAIIGLCALVPSLGSADHIPENVSQKQRLAHASADWRFNEPSGSYQLLGVSVTDETITASALRHGELEACVIVLDLRLNKLAEANDDVSRSIRGCRPITKRTFSFTGTLEEASLIAEIPTEECVSSPISPQVCKAGPTLSVNLGWTAIDPLISGSGTDTFGACIVHSIGKFRHHLVAGSIKGNGVEYTRDEEGSGFIIDRIRIQRVRPEGGQC